MLSKTLNFTPSVLVRMCTLICVLCSTAIVAPTYFGFQQAHAETPAHPFPGIWSFRKKTGPITERERAEACLKQASVTHPDGLLVTWEREESSYVLDFRRSYFNQPLYSQCSVDKDSVETCAPLNAEGTGVAEGDEDKAKLSKLANGSLQYCGFSADKGRFETGTECAEMLACPVSLFTIKGPGWELKLDVMRRPNSKAGGQ